MDYRNIGIIKKFKHSNANVKHKHQDFADNGEQWRIEMFKHSNANVQHRILRTMGEQWLISNNRNLSNIQMQIFNENIDASGF